MAKRETKSSKSETKVTRISASESPLDATSSTKRPSPKFGKKPTKAEAAKQKKIKKAPKTPGEGKGILGYFTGAWYELRQVRWPNRRATWSLTGAVLAFTAFFVVFILILDAIFKYLFEQILN